VRISSMSHPPDIVNSLARDRQVSCHPGERVGNSQKATEIGISDRYSQETPTEKCRKNENWRKLKQICNSFERSKTAVQFCDR
jgi:hypothetical protein